MLAVCRWTFCSLSLSQYISLFSHIILFLSSVCYFYFQYGFTKVRRGVDTDMYAHPGFCRDAPEGLLRLRKIVAGGSSATTSTGGRGSYGGSALSSPVSQRPARCGRDHATTTTMTNKISTKPADPIMTIRCDAATTTTTTTMVVSPPSSPVSKAASDVVYQQQPPRLPPVPQKTMGFCHQHHDHHHRHDHHNNNTNSHHDDWGKLDLLALAMEQEFAQAAAATAMAVPAPPTPW
jgi:hypothetical protein